MNPVLILTHNCLELTKKCAASIHAQEVETRILFYDNGSRDGTDDWLPDNTDEDGDMAWRSRSNEGVSKGWNWGLNHLFNAFGCGHVLVVNNDVVLPPWFLSTLLSYDAPMVTGISVGTLEEIATPPERKELAPCPDFSAFLIRRECWEKVGAFDESMKHYASDVDYHIRAQRLGVPLMNAWVPFYHERSATLRLSNPAERRKIEIQADLDRAAFKLKYGFGVDDPRCQTDGI